MGREVEIRGVGEGGKGLRLTRGEVIVGEEY